MNHSFDMKSLSTTIPPATTVRSVGYGGSPLEVGEEDTYMKQFSEKEISSRLKRP